jgi:hypothetical protein
MIELAVVWGHEFQFGRYLRHYDQFQMSLALEQQSEARAAL